MECWNPRPSTPRPVVALPWGSRSTIEDPVAEQREARTEVDRGRGLADAALLVRHGDDAGERPDRALRGRPQGGGTLLGLGPGHRSHGGRRLVLALVIPRAGQLGADLGADLGGEGASQGSRAGWSRVRVRGSRQAASRTSVEGDGIPGQPASRLGPPIQGRRGGRVRPELHRVLLGRMPLGVEDIGRRRRARPARRGGRRGRGGVPDLTGAKGCSPRPPHAPLAAPERHQRRRRVCRGVTGSFNPLRIRPSRLRADNGRDPA